MEQEKLSKKINIAIAGSPCTGKSTTAAMLFAKLKILGLDYDLIEEEYRRLKKEMGHPMSPFDRFYLWRQQEREELRSNAINGFITDTPLFQYYIQADMHASEPRDKLAVRELFRMSYEMMDRYGIVAIVKDPLEIPFKNDSTRECDNDISLKKYNKILSFIQFFYSERLVYIFGDTNQRCEQIISRLKVF